ncbi:PAS domain S-box protein [Candidatus Pacearchaeota archaeon]|nr:PAS domain S-box protein [Candidatus Pacearchaeota archaeon]
MKEIREGNLVGARYNALLKSAIISETDINGNILLVNDEFVKSFGYSKKEIIGKNHRLLNSKKHTSEFFKDLYDTISKGKIWRGIIEDITKDGDEIWLDTSIIPILNNKNKPIRYLSVRFDVTRFMK